MELTNSFEILIRSFSPVFTNPSFQTFRLLMTGWILSATLRRGGGFSNREALPSNLLISLALPKSACPRDWLDP